MSARDVLGMLGRRAGLSHDVTSKVAGHVIAEVLWVAAREAHVLGGHGYSAGEVARYLGIMADAAETGKDPSAGGESTRCSVCGGGPDVHQIRGRFCHHAPERDGRTEDEFPAGRSQIRHPSHAATRRYLAENPLPTQQGGTSR